MSKKKRTTRMPDRRRRAPAEPRSCQVPDCGRPPYAQGYCQTHHRQLLETGETRPIRPYRERSEGNVKVAGLRLTQRCAEVLQRRASQEGISIGAAIAQVLEDWACQGAGPPGGSRDPEC